MKITINDLWVLVSYDNLSGKIAIYPRIFIDKEEADRLAKEFGYEVHSAFINS